MAVAGLFISLRYHHSLVLARWIPRSTHSGTSSLGGCEPRRRGVTGRVDLLGDLSLLENHRWRH